jgi:hypothetical protein
MTKTLVCPYCEAKTPCITAGPGAVVTCIRCLATYVVAAEFIREAK